MKKLKLKPYQKKKLYMLTLCKNKGKTLVFQIAVGAGKTGTKIPKK